MSEDQKPHVPKFDLSGIIAASAEFGSAIQRIVEVGREIARVHEAQLRAAKPLFLALAKAINDGVKADVILESGWVPFIGLPMDLIDSAAGSEEASRLIDEFTSAEWPTIKAALRESVRASGVDSEAVATYEEALETHENGLYRATVRVLFPEIERVARDTVYGGDRREAPKPKQTKGNLNTGLRDFREAVMHDVPAGIVTQTRFGMTLTEKMYEHLYDWVGESEDSLDHFRRDPVPNRHASQHGYVSYASRQNSMNMLSMADFMFHLIARVHTYIEEHAVLIADRVESSPDN